MSAHDLYVDPASRDRAKLADWFTQVLSAATNSVSSAMQRFMARGAFRSSGMRRTRRTACTSSMRRRTGGSSARTGPSAHLRTRVHGEDVIGI